MPALKPMSLEMMDRALDFGWEQQVFPAEAEKVNKFINHECPFLCRREREQKIVVLLPCSMAVKGLFHHPSVGTSEDEGSSFPSRKISFWHP